MTASDKAKAYRVKNPGKAAADARAWRAKNPRAASVDSARRYAANRESEKQRTSTYRRANLDLYRAIEKANNKSKVAKNALRRARKLQATPAWLTGEEIEAIKKFYKACPVGFQVDHEIPLMGVSVCGLHVLSNLQYLSAEENLRKGNRYEG